MKKNDKNDNKAVIWWLYLCGLMVFAMAVIGAVTRLTESGLSITEWKPVTGALPPLSEADWQHAFALYQKSPEFLHKHGWMQLADFKKIFFWEWLHRFIGRMIGVVYALPLLWFACRKKIPAGYGRRLAGILTLGALQGALGWWMVKSGLAARPEVSHFRLAAHLDLALLIFSALCWTILDLSAEQRTSPVARIPFLWGLLTLALLALTLTWGAFVAGLDAGLVYNSFPLMNGHFTPPESFRVDALIYNHGWVQFAHRWLAVSTGIFAFMLGLRLKDNALCAMVLVQIGLGIFTLLSVVWIPLAALHQAGAIILLALVLRAVHRQRAAIQSE